MRAADLAGRRVAVWGLGREGRAAIALLLRHHPGMPLVVFDEAADTTEAGDAIELVRGAEPIAAALERIDVIVKSPGVSLYHPLVEAAQNRGIAITSLVNLWFAEEHAIATVCVTGSKGKSTTAALLAHILQGLGRRAALVGNIGVPITAVEDAASDCAVIEVSSYQAADFAGICDIAVLTALFPEHLDWHRSVDAYYRDKINLLRHCRASVVARGAAGLVAGFGGPRPSLLVPDPVAIHWRDGRLFDGAACLGVLANPYLARPHNLANLGAALGVVKLLRLDPRAALDAAADFRGLPHRQQELGKREGVLFVDDSISTTPESTLAALAVYAGRPIAVILGGYDRGIDYQPLVEALAEGAAQAAICLGDSGARIAAALRARRGPRCEFERAGSMREAVAAATRRALPDGVVLLSPAAPSYGQYRDFAERGRDFAAAAGLA
jgi:UDP-N-acetylmuramoyl-L-alanine---L-glutamate ligase